ncbi:hypothetical protein GOARA_010_00030 [Gordonia araii NBRC 100433]|uniref:DUF350 domain-containing protein n=1 Tax=Gordonia araii NBRC 100433 TaxID=1073574 RepID=G7GXQ5_9ACTN|nr:DUF350 domain-containing protein [Gordonia araii]NNG98060.1 DUF350 domain-containing protein [Gordonia araii NBRC 100433]GAB08380.1 hypothetical protein GOARA_010_00030 [Gordonia araii NBRC 100433]
MKSLFLDNLAGISAYGLLGIIVLLVGYFALDVVTPGRLRDLLWRESNQNAVLLTSGFLISLGVVYAASARAGFMTDQLWQGLLFAALYSLVAIAVMCFSFVLIDWLTPGRLGELLMSGNTAVVWVNIVVFVTLGVSMGATL